MSKKSLVAESIGLLSLLLLATLISAFLPMGRPKVEEWLIIDCIWIAVAEFAWHNQHAPATPLRWLVFSFGAASLAFLWFAVSRIGAALFFGAHESSGSRSFDTYVFLVFLPGLVFVGIAGAARSVVLRRPNKRID